MNVNSRILFPILNKSSRYHKGLHISFSAKQGQNFRVTFKKSETIYPDSNKSFKNPDRTFSL